MKFYLDGMNTEYSEELTNNIRNGSNVFTIGWRSDSQMWPYDLFGEKECNINLIEIFEPNANQFPKDQYNVNVICDSVENFDLYAKKEEKEKNILYWADGPEHLEMEVSKKLLEKAKEYFYLIIIQTPNGIYEQGEMYGNVHECHLSHWYEDDYKELGFKVDHFAPWQPSLIGFYLS